MLLKNEKSALPLSKSLKRVAVIGPNADEKGYALTRYGATSIKRGVSGGSGRRAEPLVTRESWR